MFDEPSTNNDGVRVLHPADRRDRRAAVVVNFTAGYNVDIVTGATPAVLPTIGVDAFRRHQVQRHAPPGSRRPRIPAPRRAASPSVALRLGERLQVRPPLGHHPPRSVRAQLHARPRVHAQLRQRLRRQQRGAAGMPINSLALTSSAGCFTADPAIVTRRLHIDTIEPSLSWTMTPAAGHPGRRHHPAPRRLPVEPVPQRARRQPEPTAAGTPPAVSPALRRFRPARLRLPGAARLHPRDVRGLRRQLGRSARSRPTSWEQIPRPLDAALGARPLPPAGRRQLLPQRLRVRRRWARPASTGPATASCRRWATTCSAARWRSSAAPARNVPPGSSRWSSSAKYEVLLYKPESPFAPNADRTLRPHRPGRVRDALLVLMPALLRR